MPQFHLKIYVLFLFFITVLWLPFGVSGDMLQPHQESQNVRSVFLVFELDPHDIQVELEANV